MPGEQSAHQPVATGPESAAKPTPVAPVRLAGAWPGLGLTAPARRLRVSGGEEEVLDAAAAHAVAKHGHQDTPELREMLRGGLQDAEPALA